MTDILKRLLKLSTGPLPQSEMMIERVEAAMEIEKLRAALETLAIACDDVGVKFFDSDDLSPEVCAMQVATEAARDMLLIRKVREAAMP